MLGEGAKLMGSFNLKFFDDYWGERQIGDNETASGQFLGTLQY